MALFLLITVSLVNAGTQDKKKQNEKTHSQKISVIIVGHGAPAKDFLAAIELFKEENPDIKIVYAWPYDVSDISNLLLNQVNKFVK